MTHNKLDEITRHRMNNSTEAVFSNQFFISMFFVLVVFMLGFITGSIAHDKCCHVIEQLQNK